MDLTEPRTPTITASTGHPRQLYILFFAEMWERFSFYGMKALLLAYMVTQLKFDEPKGYAILGSYAALVYTMPMFGGMMADKFLGSIKAVLFGGILMSVGHLVLAIPQGWSFFYGMAFIICGNGFFKPNISSLVGTLYADNDPRKDSGFSLFYMGINIGAALGGLLCGYVGQRINWHYGFGLAGIFMIVGLVVFYIGSRSFGERGLPPDVAVLKRRAFAGLSTEIIIYLTTLALVPVVVALFNRYEWMDLIMFGLGAVAIVYILIIAFQLGRAERFKLFSRSYPCNFLSFFLGILRAKLWFLKPVCHAKCKHAGRWCEPSGFICQQFFTSGMGDTTQFLFCLALAYPT